MYLTGRFVKRGYCVVFVFCFSPTVWFFSHFFVTAPWLVTLQNPEYTPDGFHTVDHSGFFFLLLFNSSYSTVVLVEHETADG